MNTFHFHFHFHSKGENRPLGSLNFYEPLGPGTPAEEIRFWSKSDFFPALFLFEGVLQSTAGYVKGDQTQVRRTCMLLLFCRCDCLQAVGRPGFGPTAGKNANGTHEPAGLLRPVTRWAHKDQTGTH